MSLYFLIGGEFMRKTLKPFFSMISIVLVLTLACISFALRENSLAWFASNDQVSANGMGVAVLNEDDEFAHVYYYKVTKTKLVDGTENFYFDISQKHTEPQVLETYSDLQGNAQVLIEVQFNEVVTDATVAVQTSTERYLGDILQAVIDAGVGPFDFDPNGANPLSNIIEYWVMSDISTETLDGKSFYSISNNSLGAPSTFVTFSGTNATFNPAATTYTLTGLKNSTVYILYDYNAEAVLHINEIITAYVEAATKKDTNYNTILLGMTNINFAPDFQFVVEEKGAQ